MNNALQTILIAPMTSTRRGWKFRPMKTSDRWDMYGTMKDLRRVWEGTYKGEQIQIMVMSSPTYISVVERFGCSVSKVWFKRSVRTTIDFLISHYTKINFLKDDYNAKETYVRKVNSYFPEYKNVCYSKYENLLKKVEPLILSRLCALTELELTEEEESVMSLYDKFLTLCKNK